MADCWKDGQLFDSRNQNISVRKLSTRNHFNPNTGEKAMWWRLRASERASVGGREGTSQKAQKTPDIDFGEESNSNDISDISILKVEE